MSSADLGSPIGKSKSTGPEFKINDSLMKENIEFGKKSYFALNGSVIFIAGSKPNPYIYNIESQQIYQMQYVLPESKSMVTSIAVGVPASDYTVFGATGYDDGSVNIWNVTKRKFTSHIKMVHKSAITNMCFLSTNQQQLFVIDELGIITTLSNIASKDYQLQVETTIINLKSPILSFNTYGQYHLCFASNIKGFSFLKINHAFKNYIDVLLHPQEQSESILSCAICSDEQNKIDFLLQCVNQNASITMVNDETKEQIDFNEIDVESNIIKCFFLDFHHPVLLLENGTVYILDERCQIITTKVGLPKMNDNYSLHNVILFGNSIIFFSSQRTIHQRLV